MFVTKNEYTCIRTLKFIPNKVKRLSFYKVKRYANIICSTERVLTHSKCTDYNICRAVEYCFNFKTNIEKKNNIIYFVFKPLLKRYSKTKLIHLMLSLLIMRSFQFVQYSQSTIMLNFLHCSA